MIKYLNLKISPFSTVSCLPLTIDSLRRLYGLGPSWLNELIKCCNWWNCQLGRQRCKWSAWNAAWINMSLSLDDERRCHGRPPKWVGMGWPRGHLSSPGSEIISGHQSKERRECERIHFINICGKGRVESSVQRPYKRVRKYTKKKGKKEHKTTAKRLK